MPESPLEESSLVDPEDLEMHLAGPALEGSNSFGLEDDFPPPRLTLDDTFEAVPTEGECRPLRWRVSLARRTPWFLCICYMNCICLWLLTYTFFVFCFNADLVITFEDVEKDISYFSVHLVFS